MKISEKLNLTKSQFELDFVDIDTERDIPLFIDSNLIRKYDSEFNAKFVETMDSFFSYLINTLSNNLLEDISINKICDILIIRLNYKFVVYQNNSNN